VGKLFIFIIFIQINQLLNLFLKDMNPKLVHFIGLMMKLVLLVLE